MNAHETIRTFRLLSGLAVVLVLAGGCSQSMKWQEYNNNAYLPAKVEAIVLPSSRIDSERTVTYGKWQVAFRSSRLPVAEHDNFANSYKHVSYSRIFISPLRCKHSIIGSVDCTMGLGYTFPDGYPQKYSPKCWIHIREQSGVAEKFSFNIRCPVDLVFG